jgi:translation initiation factor IF-3
MKKEKALQLAKERGLDLVLITDKANPPVCKLIDYGKFLYQQKKQEKKRKMSQVKGVRLRFNISLHDLETKAKQAKKFLEEGDKVKIEMMLRGREKALRSFAKEKIDKFLEILSSYIAIEIDQDLKKTPQGFILIIKRGKHEK